MIETDINFFFYIYIRAKWNGFTLQSLWRCGIRLSLWCPCLWRLQGKNVIIVIDMSLGRLNSVLNFKNSYIFPFIFGRGSSVGASSRTSSTKSAWRMKPVLLWGSTAIGVSSAVSRSVCLLACLVMVRCIDSIFLSAKTKNPSPNNISVFFQLQLSVLVASRNVKNSAC